MSKFQDGKQPFKCPYGTTKPSTTGGQAPVKTPAGGTK